MDVNAKQTFVFTQMCNNQITLFTIHPFGLYTPRLSPKSLTKGKKKKYQGDLISFSSIHGESMATAQTLFVQRINVYTSRIVTSKNWSKQQISDIILSNMKSTSREKNLTSLSSTVL